MILSLNEARDYKTHLYARIVCRPFKVSEKWENIGDFVTLSSLCNSLKENNYCYTTLSYFNNKSGQHYYYLIIKFFLSVSLVDSTKTIKQETQNSENTE